MTEKYTQRMKRLVQICAPVIQRYYRLTKPGIIYGNILTTAGGFLYGSGRHIHIASFLFTLIGTSLVIGSACVFNNYMDQDIDAFMARTSKRALVSGAILERNALIYASILGVAGFLVLRLYTNIPTVLLGGVGFISYIALYTPAKRQTEHSTLIGSISGATPIAAGYTAAAGQFDWAVALLFAIMFIWQMPHFYAIAIFRKDEYAKAGIPILTVVKGVEMARLQIIGYITAFLLLVLGFALFGYASFSFFVIMAFAGLYWLWVAVHGLRSSTDDVRWSRRIFGISLLQVFVMSLALAIDYWLP